MLLRMNGYRKRSAGYYRSGKRGRYTPKAAIAKKRRPVNYRTGGFLGIETKFYDTGLANGTLNTSTDATNGEQDPATVSCLSAPAQGDTEQNRDGNRIIIKSCYVFGTLTKPTESDQTAVEGPHFFFVALVLDTQSNGATLNSEDVFTNPSSNTSCCTQPLRNLQYSSRFRVLRTFTGVLQTQNATYDGTNIESGGGGLNFKLACPKLNIPVQFKGGATAAGVSGVNDNSLHVIAWTSDAGGAPTISYNARIRFQG